MEHADDADRLLALLRTALAVADEQQNTLVAALLTECISAIEYRVRPESATRPH